MAAYRLRPSMKPYETWQDRLFTETPIGTTPPVESIRVRRETRVKSIIRRGSTT
jgi:hypothetical protein